MKAITVWQPWASLKACGAKEYETRSWETSYRGPILIHAAAKKPSSTWGAIEPIVDKVREALGIVNLDDLPRGNIIAVANLVDCLRVEKMSDTVALLTNEYTGSLSYKAIAIRKSSREYAFGDYTPSRFAWQLENVHRLAEPIPAKGAQRLWNWDETAHQVAIDPWVIGSTKIWTPRGIQTGKRVDPGREDAVMGLEVV